MRAFLFILSLFCFCSTWAQTLQILDSKSLHPVVHASVLDTISHQYSWTDFDGKVSLESFSSEAYFFIQALGYNQVEINHAQLKARNFKLLLDPRNTELKEVIVFYRVSIVIACCG